jgi:hypothetical protein
VAMLIKNSPDKMKRKLILPAIDTSMTPLPLKRENSFDSIHGLAYLHATLAAHTLKSFLIMGATIIYSHYLVIAREKGKSPNVEETW